VEKGAIRVGTEIEAFYAARDLFGCGGARITGTFTIAAIYMNESKVLFAARGYKGATAIRIPCEDVNLLDGMNPSRFASSWGVMGSGDDVPKGKRRGRPPKVRIDG
jgi:hypothetical protein